MNYTVNQLAKLSGVTIRTLRFYDEIGLLKPAFVAENGYRYYRENELLLLQQILFFRELGFELKQIQDILKHSDFDRQATLQSHKKTLKKEIERLQTLMVTIDKTINHLQGKQTMSERELFYGLQNYSPEFQKFYREFTEKAGEENTKVMDAMYEREKNMTETEKKQFEHGKKKFWKDLVTVFKKKKLKIDHPDVQNIIKDYISFTQKYGVITTTKYGITYTSKQYWKIAAEGFRRMPESTELSIERFPELKPHYADKLKLWKENPEIMVFLADAMKLYAETKLS